MIAAAGLAYAGTGALATARPHFKVRPVGRAFALLRDARAADTAPPLREPIGGATSTVFAASFPTGDSVYAATLESGDLCVVDQEPVAPSDAPPSNTVGLIAVACSHPVDVEQHGVGLLAPSINGSDARITLLVPDGVQTVAFTESDGTTVDQAVVSNAAQYAAPNLVSASFVTTAGQQTTVVEPTAPAG